MQESLLVSKNRYGKGTAWYIGTDLEEKLLDWVLEKLLEEAGETWKRQNNAEVELVCRRGRKKGIFISVKWNQKGADGRTAARLGRKDRDSSTV